MRVVALLATYNERRFVANCLEHLHEQGIETYMIDNCSTDETVEIAEEFFDRGLLAIEQYPHEGFYDWHGLLERKQEVAEELVEEEGVDWFIHLDADEVRLPPPGHDTLAEALAHVDRQGYNAVNFLEFTFLPTLEEPDHDHPDYARTLRTYYPFCPFFPHQLKAWKAAAAPEPNLVRSGGHRTAFRGVSMYPESFPMRHYLFLSVSHAIEKYVEREYDPREVRRGWHGWRAELEPEDIVLPSVAELRVDDDREELDPTAPRKVHWIDREAAVQ